MGTQAEVIIAEVYEGGYTSGGDNHGGLRRWVCEWW